MLRTKGCSRRATHRGDVPTEAWCRYGLATVEILGGRWDRAHAHAEAAAATWPSRRALLRLPSLRTSAHLAALLGDVDEGTRCSSTRSSHEAASRGELHNLRAARQVEGLLELSLGDAGSPPPVALEEARSIAERMSVRDPGMLGLPRRRESRRSLRAASRAKAATVLRPVRRADVDVRRRRGLVPLTQRARGVVHAAARGPRPGASPRSRRRWRRSTDLPLPLEQRPNAPRARPRAPADAAPVHGARRCSTSALAALRGARRAALGRARAGGAVPASGADCRVPFLTPTEQRVAELVAAGRTNREVAEPHPPVRRGGDGGSESRPRLPQAGRPVT